MMATKAKATTKAAAKPKRDPARALYIPRSVGEAQQTLKHEVAKKQRRKKEVDRLANWQRQHKGRAIDLMFTEVAAEKRKKTGNSAVMLGDDSEALILALPLPSLGLEYFFANDGFLLTVVYQIVAPTGIGKSALLAEIGRWFHGAGGGLSLKEAETKFNPQWYRSVMTSEVFDKVPVFRCKSIEDWQRNCSFAINYYKTFMHGSAKEPGPGRCIPVVIGVDSIMGKQSEETQEKILGKAIANDLRGTTGAGHASRDYPHEAMVITKYMRTVPSLLDNWPFALVLVNHLRLGTDKQGMQTRTKSGGAQVDFQESFEIELHKEGGQAARFACADFEGYRIALKCHKNSFGPGGRRIVTRLVWWYEDGPNGPEQRTIWDWYWSTVHTLNMILTSDREPVLKARLKDAGFHLDCPVASDIEHRAWSKNLGMSKKEDALPWDEVGRMIQEDESLLATLRDALVITPRHRFQGDYLEQLNSLVASSGKRAQRAQRARPVAPPVEVAVEAEAEADGDDEEAAA